MRPVLLSLLLLIPLSARAATTPAQSCQSGKNKEIAKYASCRQQAEARFAVKPDAAARTAALQKCLDKYAAKWPVLESKAADKGGACPSAGDQSALQSAADDYTTNVATALGGGALSSCPADLASCEADVATCDTCVTQGFAGGTLACGILARHERLLQHALRRQR